ncbi:MAG: hypothetical protein GXP35_06540 [Actinobacteria bacterium]|nr:hypothetical protein [Actinomycetota bacterium]
MSKIVTSQTTNKRRGARLGAVVLALVLFAVGCSTNAEDLTDEELRTELIEALTEDDTLTDDVAACVVDGLFDNADRDQLNRMANADEDDGLPEEDTELLFSVMFDCL